MLLKLVDALLDCPSLKDRNSLSSLLNRLPSKISNAIPHGSTNLEQVTKIVETCSKYPNGLTELVEAIRFFDEGTIPLQQVEKLIGDLGLSSYRTKDKSNLSPKKTNKGPLLPYLMNRTQQTDKLISAIKTTRECLNNAGPLLCFIHGNEDQCNWDFFARLKHELTTDSSLSKEGIASYNFNCDFNNLPESIRNSLATTVLSDKFANVKITEIIQQIATYSCPVILYTRIHTQDWPNWPNCEIDNLLDSFIHLCSDWKRSFASNQLLLVCVIFYYKKKDNWFHRCFFKRKSVNQAIRKKLENLAKEDFLAKFSVPGVVLPELQDITSADVEKWAEDNLSDCYRQLLPKLRQIFADIDKLPMEHVVDKVESLLKIL